MGRGLSFCYPGGLVYGADGVDRVGVFGLLIRAVALDAGKAQGEPAGIMRARLDVIEGDLDHELRLDINRVSVAGDRELTQLGGLPRQHFVRHALEGLSQHHKRARARVSCPEVQVAEPAGAPAVAPFGGDHHEIEGSCGLDLEPGATARARVVGSVQGFRHDTFVAGCQSRL
jgi:hypothetical protein